jgi:hypothetical protein
VRVTNDAVFGRLLQKNSWWSGEVNWPHGPDRVGVMIFRAPEEPTEKDRRAFVAIREAYVTLLPQISEALFSLWQSACSNARQSDVGSSDPGELMALLRLECVCIERSANVELMYEGRGGLFTVRVAGGTVTPRAFDGGPRSEGL